jgi:hypothetical protein
MRQHRCRGIRRAVREVEQSLDYTKRVVTVGLDRVFD